MLTDIQVKMQHFDRLYSNVHLAFFHIKHVPPVTQLLFIVGGEVSLNGNTSDSDFSFHVAASTPETKHRPI